MEQDQLSSLFSSGELGERYKVDHLAEAVHDGQDDSVAVRGGKTRNKVQGYVGPWAMRNRKRLKQPSRWPAGGFVLIASGTGFDEFLDVLLQGGPPETLEKGMSCPLYPRVAEDLGGVGP